MLLSSKALSALAQGAVGLSALALGASASNPSAAVAGDTLVVKAGTIHLVEGGQVVEGGAILIRDGRVAAVGTDLDTPPGVTVVDYGPYATIVPGFVAADSSLADGPAPERTAAPELDAIDGFDFYASHTSALAAGVTSVYVTPARDRLIAGRGAVISLGEGDPADRILRSGATIHGAISAEARSTPGYWEPPIPATSDVGLGVPQNQLPRSTMGAIMALDTLLDGVAAGQELDAYGPVAIASLTELIEGGAAWRVTAVEEHEIRALIEFAGEHDLKLIVDGAHGAGDLAEELAAIGASVVFEVPFEAPTGSQQNQNFIQLPDGRVIFFGGFGGTSDVGEAKEFELDVPARLIEAGVDVAITPARGSALRDLSFAAALASRGGLDHTKALEALTLAPARMYGVAGDVGSLTVGKRADFCVLNGAPLTSGTTVSATWVGGQKAWSTDTGDARVTVVSVDSLHLGDGRVLEPGEVLMRDGVIVEVARRASRPPGAVVVRGAAAMPGMIDAGGRLGLDGSRRMPSTDFDLSLIVEPGDETDRLVAKAGVTSVLLDPRGDNSSGAPIMAYRPAADSFDTLVIDSPAALRLKWGADNRYESGKAVTKLLADAVKYREDWDEYAEKLAKWEPDEVRPEFRLPGADDEDGDDEEEEEEEDSKEKKKRDKEIDPDPVTGIWLTQLEVAEGAEPVRTRMQIRLEDGEVSGFLRSAALSSSLLEVSGTWEVDEEDEDENSLVLEGEGDNGPFRLAGSLDDITRGAEETRFQGSLTYGELEVEIDVPRISRDYPVARLPERPRAESEDEEAPKGKPKEPRANARLEPLKRALEGDAAVVVAVERADEILACVDAFEAVGLRPILLGAADAGKVADRIAGRVAGVLLDSKIVSAGVVEDEGYRLTNRYAALQAAGIPVAFRSESEGGAAELALRAAYAVAYGMSPTGALKALTSDAARMFAIDDEVGTLAPGLAADLLLLDGPPLELSTSIERVWVAGKELR